jgi:hypothetical protein
VVSAARISTWLGVAAMFCGIASFASAFTMRFDFFFLLAWPATLLGLAGLVLGIAGLVASRGDRSYGLVGAVTALIGFGLPVLFVVGLIAALSNME